MNTPLDTRPATRRSFLVGVYLATNAIADAATVVDGPDCTFFKAEFIHGRHDLNSRLLDVLGQHRILTTHTNTDGIAQSVGAGVIQRIEDAQRLGDIGLVMVTAMPMVSIIGLQYDQLIRALPTMPLEVVAVEGRSLQGDWLDGYADVLAALADRLEPAPQPPAQDSVSIIGHFMDRNEEDQRGNVRELRRLVEGLGLRLESVWLSGEDWATMRRAARCSTLVTFPLGAEAGRRLAARTGARVVDVQCPVGLARSAAFLRKLGAATGRSQEAEQLIEAERTRCVAPLEWAVPHYFLGLRVALSATPELLWGLWELLTELGVEVVEAISPSRPRDDCEAASLGGLKVGFDVNFDHQHWQTTQGPELIIGDTWAATHGQSTLPVVELGFPSYQDHALQDRPFLGYRGHTALVQRILSALATAGGRRREPLPEPGQVG